MRKLKAANAGGKQQQARQQAWLATSIDAEAVAMVKQSCRE